MKEIYINANDEQTYNKIIETAKNSKYKFTFPCDIMPTFYIAKKYYNRNSKILINLFFNDINGKYEMQVTTRKTALSYPQAKHINVLDFNNINFETILD